MPVLPFVFHFHMEDMCVHVFNFRTKQNCSIFVFFCLPHLNCLRKHLTIYGNEAPGLHFSNKIHLMTSFIEVKFPDINCIIFTHDTITFVCRLPNKIFFHKTWVNKPVELCIKLTEVWNTNYIGILPVWN